MRMALWDNMDMVGKRINWKADYQVSALKFNLLILILPTRVNFSDELIVHAHDL